MQGSLASENRALIACSGPAQAQRGRTVPRQEVWEASAHAAATLPNAADWVAARGEVHKRFLIGPFVDHDVRRVRRRPGDSTCKTFES